MKYIDRILSHYERLWSSRAVERRPYWPRSKVAELGDFIVAEFRPGAAHDYWIYATCGMGAQPARPLELYLFAPRCDSSLVELMSAVAHYHLTEQPLWYGHTVNFGRPWLDTSKSVYGLVSRPYLDGPHGEIVHVGGGTGDVSVAWLLPIMPNERAAKIDRGLEYLEELFERNETMFADPQRPGVI